MVNLPLAFYKELKDDPNVDFLQGHRVNGIYYDGSNDQVKVKSINLFNEQIEMNTFDYVICAIPFSTLRVVDICPEFSNRKMQAIREVNFSSSHKTIMLCNERFWEQPTIGKPIVGGGSFTDMAINSVWYPSHKNNNQYGVFTASYNAELDATRIANLSGVEQFSTIKRQTEELHGLPNCYLDQVVMDYKIYNWNRDEHALGAFCYFNPEQNRVFSYDSITPEYNKRIFFAGSHVSPFHSWAQGVLQSGMVAANNIVEMCKIRL